ncbi:MAG: SDR family oxidoreductase [Syntrophales bacterium]|nr:SDR family oxidoreductase [Syntrophales bacterium]
MENYSGFYNQKLVLITGGSSGIGRALALKLSEAGAKLALVARRRELLDEVRSRISGPCLAIPADVVDFSQMKKVVAEVENELGVPDILINSAGAAHPGYVEELSLSIFREMMEVNYFGTVNTVKACLAGMIARRSGWIVNISSVAGFIGVFGYTAYGASKYAVRGFSDALRAELKPKGIGVSIVFPPDTDTPQLAYENRLKPPETKALAGNAGLLSPEQVADEILKSVRKGRYLILPGKETKILYLLHHLLGCAIYPTMDLLIRKAQRRLRKGGQ